MLSDRDYKQFARLIYDRTGVWFEENKRTFLWRRIQERIGALGLSGINEYFNLLYSGRSEKEWQSFIDCITINETYFFRDFPQLAAFAEQVLPQVAKAKEGRGDFRLRLWSAGCASGEEPYTLAIILREMLPRPPAWNIEILATDINSRVLSQARRAVYDSRSVRDVPPEYLERYFVLTPQGYALKAEIKKMVDFFHLNLFDGQAAAELKDFDFIFCRNVLIYFDDASRQRVVETFYRALRSGGYIFLGHSESVGRISGKFKMSRLDGHIVYYKP